MSRRISQKVGTLAVLLCCACLVAGAVNLPGRRSLGVDVRGAVRCAGSGARPEALHVYQEQDYNWGSIAVWYTVCPSPYEGEPPWQRLGYVLRPNGPLAQLRIAGGGLIGDSKPRRLGPVEYVSRIRGDDQPALVYGRALDSQVRAVEARFDTGEVVRANLAGGSFALVAPRASGACELRVLGDDAVVQHQSMITTDAATLPKATLERFARLMDSQWPAPVLGRGAEAAEIVAANRPDYHEERTYLLDVQGSVSMLLDKAGAATTLYRHESYGQEVGRWLSTAKAGDGSSTVPHPSV